MTGTDLYKRTHKSVPVIFEPPCTLLPTFVGLNTWSLFLDISLCALLISRPSYKNELLIAIYPALFFCHTHGG